MFLPQFSNSTLDPHSIVPGEFGWFIVLDSHMSDIRWVSSFIVGICRSLRSSTSFASHGAFYVPVLTTTIKESLPSKYWVSSFLFGRMTNRVQLIPTVSCCPPVVRFRKKIFQRDSWQHATVWGSCRLGTTYPVLRCLESCPRLRD